MKLWHILSIFWIFSIITSVWYHDLWFFISGMVICLNAGVFYCWGFVDGFDRNNQKLRRIIDREIAANEKILELLKPETKYE